jgi:hypothetical protein
MVVILGQRCDDWNMLLKLPLAYCTVGDIHVVYNPLR